MDTVENYLINVFQLCFASLNLKRILKHTVLREAEYQFRKPNDIDFDSYQNQIQVVSCLYLKRFVRFELKAKSNR